MLKFLFKLWPAFVPIIVLLLWLWLRRGKKAEAKLSGAETRLWTWTLIASLVIAIICMAVMLISADDTHRGRYVRPHYDNHGGVMPGKVVPLKEQTE